MNRFIFDTSGTTGAAKQVVMREDALLAMAETDVADLEITNKSIISVDRWGITGIQECYWAKLSGARLAFPPQPRLTRQWINNERVTHLNLLATTFRWLCAGLYKFPTVEFVLAGGEMVDWGDAELARESFPNAKFFNRYACMETRVVCRKQVKPGETGQGRMPVGKPVEDVAISIVNTRRFAEGEIVVKSPYMADGYYNDPELTAAKFINGWYYTGDLGYWLPNGELMHCGRKDFAVVKDQFNAENYLHGRNMKAALNGGDVR